LEISACRNWLRRATRIDGDALAPSRLETNKMLNPTLATLHKWAQALGRKLEVDLASA
jgi:transcriptional regulator with XRE-family HTH domain